LTEHPSEADRNPADGRFLKGNQASAGRRKPHYDRTIALTIREELAATGGPDGRNARAIVRAMVKEAKGGNVKAAEFLRDSADGKPVQRQDVDVIAKARQLAIQYGLDPDTVLAVATRIAQDDEEDNAFPTVASVPPESDADGGSPGPA
jgi:hypothetical protein